MAKCKFGSYRFPNPALTIAGTLANILIEKLYFMSNLGKVIIDTVVFALIYVIGKLILFGDLFNRSTGEKVLILFLAITSIGFTYYRNKPNLSSIFYGILITFVLTFSIDSRNNGTAILPVSYTHLTLPTIYSV